MTEPKGAGQWLLFSSLLSDLRDDERERVGRYLLDRVASRHIRPQYFWADDKDRLYEPRIGDKGCAADLARLGLRYPPRKGHRREQLPDEFWRLGQFMDGWQFSSVTFGGRTIVELELFFPDVAPTPPAVIEAAAIVETAAPEPYRTGAQGRPTSKQLLLAEAERRLTSSGPKKGEELEDFATEMRKWLAKEHPAAPQIGQSGAKNILRDIWNSYKGNA
jgi:hypothetical protein